MFLGCLSSNDSTVGWRDDIQRHRSHYGDLRTRLVDRDPNSTHDDVDLRTHNPLSQASTVCYALILLFIYCYKKCGIRYTMRDI